jgi:hypothetical protein
MSEQEKALHSPNLTVPIYIDTNVLLDLLASIEDGFSMVEKVTTQSGMSEVTERSVRGEFGVANVLNLLKLDFGVLGGRKKAKGSEEERQLIRYHTYGSLLHRLRKSLLKEKLIKRFDSSDQSWSAIQPSDFVELHGVFRPNPLVESLTIIDRLMGIACPFIEAQSPITGISKSGGKKTQTEAKQLDQIRKSLNDIRSNLEQTDIRVFSVELATRPLYKAVVSLFIEYLRDKSMTELVHGDFWLLGKVVRNLAEARGESIDLLRGTGFGGVSDEIRDQILSSFDELGAQGIKLPKVETRIMAPALQVVPIAIYV